LARALRGMFRRAPLILALAFFASAGVSWAQTIGPGGGPIAPGPSQPRGYTPGGTGAGGVTVAPGPAARGVNVDRDSPGGRLAPGSAGSVSTAPAARTTTVLRTPRAAIVKKAKKRRPVHSRKRKRTPVIR
jgi:hypothetical protein